MSHLVAVVFDDDAIAFEMRAALLRVQKQALIALEDSVVVVNERSGNIELDQTMNLTPFGVIGGGLWGIVIGLIFSNPLIGGVAAAAGATAAGIAGRVTDFGIDDQMVRNVRQALKPGTSALFILVLRAEVDQVLADLKTFTGRARIFQTSLDADDEATLRQAFEQAA